MMQGKKYIEFAKDITDESIATANSLISAACLVFAHAVFDATLFDYCRVTALQSWGDWLDPVKTTESLNRGDRRRNEVSDVAELGQRTC